jgi:hypothetical protein
MISFHQRHAGFKLKYNDIGYPQEGYDSCEKRTPWIIGDLYGRPGGFNEKRWLFWKERFKTLRDQEDLKRDKKYADKAWREMVRLDQ